jgi:hypothetical protein
MDVVDVEGLRQAQSETAAYVADGEALVLDFGDGDHEQVFKYLTWIGERYRVELTIRHAEFTDYLNATLQGAAIGGAAGAIAALAAGGPISWALIATGAGIGALIGLAATSLSVKVYRHKGNTRVKILPA